MKRSICFYLIALLVSIVLFAGVALADTFETRPHEWTDKQTLSSELKVAPNRGVISNLTVKIASIVMTGVDYTLSAAEALCNILVVTGTPSGQSIIAPTLTKTDRGVLYTVRNAGGDSGTVTIKASGETGVDVATGKTAEVYWLTDDYVRKTADATH